MPWSHQTLPHVVYWQTEQFITDVDGNIFNYDITTKNNTALISIPDLYSPCITKHPRKQEIYLKSSLVSGTNAFNSVQTKNFYIYAIEKNNYTILGNGLNHGNTWAACSINEYYKDPH